MAWFENIHTIYCIGLNYRAHAEETGKEAPERPVVFMKPRSAIVGDGAVVRIPRSCVHGPELDYEGELAVWIGKTGKDISASNALSHIAGYAIANDITARRWQRHAGAGQWIRGKGFDGFCAVSDAFVPASELNNPQSLTIETKVNGEIRQSGSTNDMIFSVAEIIAYLSQDTTLLQDTLILTGTPAGVGVAKTPPMFLQSGDQVTVRISTIGSLETRIQ